MVDIIGRAKIIVESVVDTKSIDSSTGKLSSGLRKGAVIGVAALGTLAVAGVKTYKAFEAAEAQSRKLNTVLGNMGKSDAGPAVEKLAEKLSDLTAVDDDVIKQGETLLATFSNVAESAGDAGGVFERATTAAVDLAATGFGSVESASVMLGKALQDPVKGITALGRAGVTFSEDQKKLIESMVAANDVAGAQKLILQEVEKQVGGTAAATVTESARISKEMGELQENLGALVADLVEGGEDTTSFSDALHKVNKELKTLDDSKSWASIRGGIRGIGHAMEFVVDGASTFLEFFYDAGAAVGHFVDDLRDALRQIPFLGEHVRDNPRDKDVPFAGLLDPNANLFLDLPKDTGKGSKSSSSSSGGLSSVSAASVNNTFILSGPNSLSEARSRADWQTKYGTRFGASTSAGGL